MSEVDYICGDCGAYLHGGRIDEEYGYVHEWCGHQVEEEGNPYDDEGDLAYSDVARGEEAAPAVDARSDNPAYPPRLRSGHPRESVDNGDSEPIGSAQKERPSWPT